MLNLIRGQRTLDNAPLDLDILLSRCLGRIELVERLIGRFQEALDADIEELEELVRAGSSTQVARLAHRMKGSSLTIGAHGIQECAQRLESSAAADDRNGIDGCLAELKQERNFLEELFSDLNSSNK